MKKKDNSLLVAVLCGIVVCVIMVGIYILSPKNTNETNSGKEENNEITEINDGEMKAEEENSNNEVSLGDSVAHCSAYNYSYIKQSTSTYTNSTSCSMPAGCVASLPTASSSSATSVVVCTLKNCFIEDDSSSSIWNVEAYRKETTTCSKCEANYYLSGSTCSACPSGYSSSVGSTSIESCTRTVAAGYGLTWTGSATVYKCTGNLYAPTSRTVKAGQSSGCTTCTSGKVNDDNTACITTKAVITCSNNTYNGHSQTIATCSGGTISNATRTIPGTQEVACIGDASHLDADVKTCKISPSPTATVGTCASNLVYDGKSHTLVTGGSNVEYNNNVQTNPGTYKVTAKAGSFQNNYYTFTDGSTYKTIECTIEERSPAVAVTGVSLNASGTITLEQGNTYQLKATVTPPNASDKTVTWVSSNNTYVDVSSTGYVTAKKAGGSATITVTTKSGNKKATVVVNTVARQDSTVKLTSIVVSPTTLTIEKGKTATFKASVLPDGATDDTVTITSGNTKVATVSTSSIKKNTTITVTGVEVGSATITLSSSSAGVVSKTVTVTVTEASSGEPVNSVTPTGKHYYLALPYSDSSAGSTITVTYEAKDADNKLTSVDWSLNPTSWSYATSKLNSSSGTKTTVTYTAAASGGASTVSKTYTITGKNDATKSAQTTITIYCKWNKTGDSGGKYSYGGTTSKRTDRNGMRYSSGCYAYEVEKTVEKSGKTYYYYDRVYNRCCGTSAPTAPTEKCYKDANGEYHWTSTKKDGYTEVTSITTASKCVTPVVKPACYVNGDKYYWGTSPESGYKKVSSITEEKDCKKTTTQYYCYVKGDDYKWASTAPTGYTKVDGVNTSSACKKAEKPACYLHDDDFEWGLYEDTAGYVKVEDITTEAKCVRPSSEACYKDSAGNYEWGDFSGDKNHTLVPNIKTIDQCTTPVPVPQTALNVSQLIYVFMAILMAAGIGFIYYANISKKED